VVFNLADFRNLPNHQNKFYTKFSSYTVRVSYTGLGFTQPDPAGTRVLDGGIEVPMGTALSSGITGTSLLYNEYPFVLINAHLLYCLYYHLRYIVYDVAQINMKYLLKLKFCYK